MTISLSKLENILYLLFVDNEKEALMYLQECAQPREKYQYKKRKEKYQDTTSQHIRSTKTKSQS